MIQNAAASKCFIDKTGLEGKCHLDKQIEAELQVRWREWYPQKYKSRMSHLSFHPCACPPAVSVTALNAFTALPPSVLPITNRSQRIHYYPICFRLGS